VAVLLTTPAANIRDAAAEASGWPEKRGSNMGTLEVDFQVGNLGGTEFIDVNTMVDTGSNYCLLPGTTLTRLGVRQEYRQQFELADGRIVEYPMGQVRMRLEGKELIVPVIFAPEGTVPLLGVTALEIFSLGMNRVNQRLMPIPSMLK
jgi:clan AA aspartic protease